VYAPHVRWWFDAGDVFQYSIPYANNCDESASGVLPPVVAHADAAHKYVKCTPADKTEHEGGIAGDLRRYLEFCIDDHVSVSVLSLSTTDRILIRSFVVVAK